ncbi:MAG: hypothetical protein HYV60_03820 [Planctomycetia bacterium]|nr:hypothetical protein [Planctomycetia bacterium]
MPVAITCAGKPNAPDLPPAMIETTSIRQHNVLKLNCHVVLSGSLGMVAL